MRLDTIEENFSELKYNIAQHNKKRIKLEKSEKIYKR